MGPKMPPKQKIIWGSRKPGTFQFIMPLFNPSSGITTTDILIAIFSF